MMKSMNLGLWSEHMTVAEDVRERPAPLSEQGELHFQKCRLPGRAREGQWNCTVCSSLAS